MKKLNLINKMIKFVQENLCDAQCESCEYYNQCPVPEAQQLVEEELGEDYYE